MIYWHFRRQIVGFIERVSAVGVSGVRLTLEQFAFQR